MAVIYLDNDVAVLTATLLQTRGHTTWTARDKALRAAGDEVQLLTAAQQQWVLLTHNRKDFVLLHNAWHAWSTAWGVAPHHSGILIVPQWHAAQIAQQVDTFLVFGVPLVNTLYEWRAGRGWIKL